MNHTFNEYLNQFLDETISDIDESSLFSMIHADSELRQQFVAAVRVHAAAPALAQRSTIPHDLTTRIMATSTAASTTTGGAPFWTSGLLSPILAALLSSAFFLSGYATGSTVSHNAVVDTHMHSSPSLTEPVGTLSEQAIPAVVDRPERPPQRNAVASSPDLHTESPNDLEPSRRIQPSLIAHAPTPIELHSITTASFIESRSSLQRMSARPKTLMVSLRTLHPIGAGNVGVPSNDNSGINNVAVDAMLHLSDHVSMGIEVGRQSFLQTFQRADGAVTEEVRQYPALWWSGPTARLTGRDLFADGLSPFSQATLGISDGGVIARALAGIEWRPADIVSIQGAMECSNLWYSGGGAPNTSLTFNWTLGVGILW
jgi:hypothetical protein